MKKFIYFLMKKFNYFLVKKFFDWTIMGGATIIPRSLKTTRNEKNFQDRPKKILILKSHMTLKYLQVFKWRHDSQHIKDFCASQHKKQSARAAISV